LDLRRKPLPEKLRRPIPAPFGPEAAAYYQRELIERLGALLKYYAISEQDPTRWIQLSVALARDSIPGFRFEVELPTPKPRGRPRKRALTIRRRRGPGAPRKWTGQWYEIILDGQREGAKLLRAAGALKVTDESALEAWLKFLNKEWGVVWSSEEMRSRARAWAKRLPDARKAVRKTR
jgi:hypothetical protein